MYRQIILLGAQTAQTQLYNFFLNICKFPHFRTDILLGEKQLESHNFTLFDSFCFPLDFSTGPFISFPGINNVKSCIRIRAA
jgi:hypothetical protein